MVVHKFDRYLLEIILLEEITMVISISMGITWNIYIYIYICARQYMYIYIYIHIIYIYISIKISDPPLIKDFPGHVLPVLDDAFWQLTFEAWLCDDVFSSMVHFPVLNYENYGFSRMRSKGSRFTPGVWGLRLFARRCSAVRNRSQVSV